MPGLVDVRVTNTYKAAYFLIAGGKLDGVEERKVKKQRMKRTMISREWVFHISGVPITAIEEWSIGSAKVYVRELEMVRKRLKKDAEQAINDF